MNRADRNAMPGDAPTDEDLRHDVELTREELGQTTAELADKAHVKRRASEATQRKVEPIKRNPGISAAAALAVLVLVIVVRHIRNRL